MTDDGDREPRRAATEALARAWNRLDPGVVAPWLSEDVRYDSFDTELELCGRRQVLAYLERKVELIALVGEAARVRAELGVLAEPGEEGRPCVISTQGNRGRRALFLVSVNADGLVERVEVVGSGPYPDRALATGVVPE